MRKDTKKILATVCAAALFVTSLPFMGIKVSKAESFDIEPTPEPIVDGYGLENPRVQYMTRDIVEFGHYWQEDTNGDGVADENDEKTPIRWQVLERNGDELFLLADKILDRKASNDEYTSSITWENCTLRSWLNGDFYNSAFSSAEKAGIKESSISNPDNPKYDTEGGNVTKDRVFLMSIDEMLCYGFNEDSDYSDQARKGKVTEYAKEKGLSVVADGTDWWLRSPGRYTESAAYVYYSGSVSYNGVVVCDGSGVRPALRINLSSLSGFMKDVGKENVAVKAAEWDTVTFGSYNGNALTWRVLNVSGDDAFLLSDKIIAKRRYNATDTSITWENCTLRTWLNGDFYNSAFNSNEKSMIKDTNVINEDNEYYETAGGNNTTDKAYLLSLSEITNPSYGFPDADGVESDTLIAYASGSDDACIWWLRSPGGLGSDYAAGVHMDIVNNNGSGVYGRLGVRPALHINLSSSAWTKDEKVTAGSFVEQPTPTPTAATSPTSTPTAKPTSVPTTAPTATAEPEKTEEPVPTEAPTEVPTEAPDTVETPAPTQTPSQSTQPDNGTVTAQNTPNPSTTTILQPTESEKTLTISSVKCKKNTKKITGKLSVSGATVKIKVGKKAAKKATVKGKKFTLKLSYKLKKKTKVTITVTKKDYKTLKKVYVVK